VFIEWEWAWSDMARDDPQKMEDDKKKTAT
jgi:hypothetical protein